MTASTDSSSPSWPLGVATASLIFTALGWFWFAICFTARTGAWWNSIYLFVILYAITTILAVCGIRSALAILALLLAVPSLGIVCIFAFDR